MKIAVLLSGGVDSSVALMLLKEQGFDVTAFYLKIWLEDELSFLNNCPWQEDLDYAQAVCKKAGVNLQVISLQKEYHDRIVSYTISEIEAGRTPNPDVLCNQYIKFGSFHDKLSPDYTYIASGHYAQRILCNGVICLKKSPDEVKDQTYFLSQLSQEQIRQALFPIGKYTKAQIRELAKHFDLPNKDRKDSQGICFLGKLKFNEFIRYHVGNKTGDIIEYETGKKLGIHNGFWYYTIGQRQGLGLAGGPWYVVTKDIDKNIIYISKSYYSKEKLRNKFTVTDPNWIALPPVSGSKLYVKLRHGPAEHLCTITKIDNKNYLVELEARDQGLAPGQFAAFYDNEICLGSAKIAESFIK